METFDFNTKQFVTAIAPDQWGNVWLAVSPDRNQDPSKSQNPGNWNQIKLSADGAGFENMLKVATIAFETGRYVAYKLVPGGTGQQAETVQSMIMVHSL